MGPKEMECEFNRVKEFTSQFTVEDIYYHCKIPVHLSRVVRKKIGVRSKHAFYSRVLIRFFDIVLNDLIDNGNKFELANNHFMFIEQMSPELTKMKYKNGGYKNVDNFASDFTLYQLIIKHQYNKYYCRIDQERYKRICDNVNNGKRYATYSFR